MAQLTDSSPADSWADELEPGATVRPGSEPIAVVKCPSYVVAFFAKEATADAPTLPTGLDPEALNQYRTFIKPGWDRDPCGQFTNFWNWAQRECPPDALDAWMFDDEPEPPSSGHWA